MPADVDRMIGHHEIAHSDPVAVHLAHDEWVDAIFRRSLESCRFLPPRTGCATWWIGWDDHFNIKRLRNHRRVASALERPSPKNILHGGTEYSPFMVFQDGHEHCGESFQRETFPLTRRRQ